MATEEISARLSLRDRLRFSRDATAAERSISGIGRALAGFAKGIGVVGGAMGAMGIAAGVAGLTLGVKTAANMETANIAFSTMLGSGKKAAAFLADLQAFAAKTPFEFPELQTAASSLISAGVNANKVIPIMTSLGNATSGMGTGSEGVKRATVALQQMSAAGRITGEDLNQLRDAGVPVFDLLAAATGKSKKEVAGLAQAGKLGGKELGQLMKALETGKGLERFTGLMDKQSASLSGTFSTLKDNVTMGLAKALKPLMPDLTKATLKLGELAKDVLPKLSAWLGRTVVKVKAFWKSFVALGGMESLKGLLRNLGKLFGGLAGSMGGAGDQAGTLKSAVDGISGVIGFAAKHITGLKVVVLALALAFGGPVTVLGALALAFVWAWKKSQTFRTIITSVAHAVLTVVDKILGAVQGLMTGLGHLPGKLGAPFRAAAKGIQGARDKIHGLQTDLDNLGRKPTTVTVLVGMVASLNAAGKKSGRHFAGTDAKTGVTVGTGLTRNATGGRVRAGIPTIVGELRPELFVPDSDGRILPRVPSLSGGDVRGGDGAAARPLVVQVVLDGRVVAESTASHVAAFDARNR